MKTKKTMRRVSLRVSGDLLAMMQETARRQGKTTAQLVRDAIDHGLEDRLAGGKRPRGPTMSAMVRGMVEDHLAVLRA